MAHISPNFENISTALSMIQVELPRMAIQADTINELRQGREQIINHLRGLGERKTGFETRMAGFESLLTGMWNDILQSFDYCQANFHC
jgi:hypothetical protein